jgi:NADH:ubiquinone oxidoreductase subunit F (NADH-binding)/(2Fe-2S) ferredoxin/NAD-dependent dihydropyrimidine dehydrogenase PreA subunit
MGKLSIEDLNKIREQEKATALLRDGAEGAAADKDGRKYNLMLCAGTACVSMKSREIKEALDQELKKHGLENQAQVVLTGCNGFCAVGPVMLVMPDGVFYHSLKVEDVPELVEEHLVNGKPFERLLYKPSEEEAAIPRMKDIKFFAHQTTIALRNKGLIDPEEIDDYIARDGYKALVKALTEMTPEQVVEEVTNSGLRGRGGGGFSTGRKWGFAAGSSRSPKYLISNADEGDPGAYMDRSIIEADPHSMLEGMIVGAYAVGSNEGYVYIRTEYPLARYRLGIAIQQAREYGLLGEDILGTGVSWDIHIKQGAGAFVCGESSALRASIEGRVGEPSAKYDHATEKGLWEQPTVLNNVETYANIPPIINKGADWFAGMGTEKSKGTKVFSLVGNIENTGLIEVQMGTTLREIIYDIGGGIPNNKKFKAVQTGGPSGGCLPESCLDMPVDFDQLTEAGSMMGSGGMIVMDEGACIVNVAKYFIEFCNDESCGKCTSCRDGSEALLVILERISEGEGQEGDIELLEELSNAIIEASLCGLGTSLPNPVLSTLQYFKDEYIEHIRDKKCAAKVCKALFEYEVILDKCKKCGICFKNCPSKAIKWEKKQTAELIHANCVKCGICVEVCKFGAIE